MMSRHFLDLVWTVLSAGVVRGFLVFVAAYMIVGAGKKVSAGYKHLIWFLVILSCLLVPLVWFSLPTAQNAVQIPTSTTEFTRILSAPLLSREHYYEMVASSNTYAVLSGHDRGLSPTWWQLLMVSIWSTGIVVVAVRGIVARLKLRRIADAAVEYDDSQGEIRVLIRRFKVRKRITVLISRQCAMPFTFGVINHRIVLPRSSQSWTVDRWRSVLIHELAHVRYQHYLITFIAQIICSLFWFVPYLWVAYARMVREAEMKCDGFVIETGIRGTEYANHLVEIVHSSRGHILLPKSIPSIGGKDMLRERIQKILAQQSDQGKTRHRVAGVVLLVCFCCVLPFFAVTCTTKPYVATADEPLYGTWINEEYETLGLVRRGWNHTKLVIVPEGKIFVYAKTSAPVPGWEGRLTFAEKWTESSGDVYYKVEYTCRRYPYDENLDCSPRIQWYVIFRINPAGEILDSVWNQVKYAEEFSHVAGWLEVHYRQ